MALFYPAAAWTTSALGSVIERRSSVRWVRWILPALIVVPSLFTTWIFAQHYADNVRVVRDQQVKMAGWVRANLPEDARVGVHDVGLLRYFGDRSLYDVVGLTTDGPSVAWRQGPGAIYESMADSDSRPDYFAIYPDVQGLRYLLDAEVFGDVLAEFRVDLPASNVASATDYQAVYEADWSGTRDEERVAQDSALNYTAGMELVDQIDVANLDSETAHGYQWDFGVELPGFVSEVYHLPYMACDGEGGDCWATDGVRVLGGSEQFALETRPGEDLLLVTRVHGRSPVALTVRINDRWQSSRVQPAVPGRWVEVVTLIPGDVITSRETHVDIAPAITDLNSAEGAYRPAYHWAFQGDFARELSNETPVATFGSGDEVELLGYALTPNLPGEIRVNLNWQLRTGVLGDSLLFLHLYDDIDAPPVAQVVSRSGNGALPPGNWLPGLVEDDLTVALPEELAPGAYTVALGLFDAVTGERYPVNGPGAISDRRLFIGEITIKE